jgi:hypothetical protein
MRSRVEMPSPEARQVGAQWVVSLTLPVDGRRLESGPQRARTQKLAEQLAAQALLIQLAEPLQESSVRALTAVDTERLRALNPKGKLFERCAQEKIKLPSFEQKNHPRGQLRRGVLVLAPGQKFCSSWYLAPTGKEAEQGACQELLEAWLAWKGGTLDPSQITGDERVSAAEAPEKNPKMVLNELRQKGEIEGFGFELVEKRGAMHAPSFVMRAWALRDGERIESKEVERSSKRDGEHFAALDLVRRLDPPGDEG